ncbi:MAG TPA: HAMP domain-containing protein, partial [Bradyrhizobium sp.]|nr:HAMP domain-containing protein [Bradyrhizobium sp.]
MRFRGKISLGFAVVLAITAVSMGFAYLGFEHVSAGVAAYRASVSESDLAQNIDRELISYRALARYYVATGKEDDAKAALAAEAALKEAIDQSMKNTTNPARINQVTRLGREFHAFTKIFADVVKSKRDSELVSQNQLMRSGNLLRYKLDDLPSGVEDDSALAAITLAAKKVAAQFQTAMALANTFIVNSDQSVAASALARLKFVETALDAIPTGEEKVTQSVTDAKVQLEEYHKALTKLVDHAKEIDELSIEMADSTVAIMKASNAMKADLLADQQRFDSESVATISETERLIVALAIGGFLLGGVLAIVLGRGISRPMIAMCKAMRELAGGNFDVVLPGLGRRDELGDMAAAVEEFK